MQSPEPFLIFTRALNKAGIRYMVSGSVAAIYYGEPRMTNDVDLILFIQSKDAPLFEKAFPEQDFYCPPREVIQLECARELRGHFNLIHHGTGFKAYIYLSGRDALHAWGIAHAVEADLEGDRVVFAPPEYVMIRKLQFFREGQSQKHLRDISRMLSGLGPDWPRKTLDEMIIEHGLTPQWNEIHRQFPVD